MKTTFKSLQIGQPFLIKESSLPRIKINEKFYIIIGDLGKVCHFFDGDLNLDSQGISVQEIANQSIQSQVNKA